MADTSSRRRAAVTRPGPGLEQLASARYALPAVIGLGVLLRVLAGLVVGPDVPRYEFGVIATNLTTGRGYSLFGVDESGLVSPRASGTPLPSAFMPPLYPLLVALVQLVVDGDLVGRVLQGLNLLLAGVLIHAVARLTRALAQSHLAGLLAGLLVAGYPTLVYSATQVSASNLYLPLEVALLGLLLRAATGLSPARALLLGLGLGVLALLRAEAVALVPLLAVWLWRSAPAPRGRRKVLLLTSMVLVAALPPLAWMVNSSARLGAPVTSVSTTAGYNLWIGNHEGATGSQKQTFLGEEGRARAEQLEESIRGLPTTDDYELQRDDVYLREALHHIRTHPLETLGRDVKKLGLVVVGDVYDPRSNVGTAALNLLVLGAGLWGALGTRLPRGTWVLLLGYAATAVAVCFVFFTLERYTLPLDLVLMMFFAVRLADVLSGRGREARPQG